MDYENQLQVFQSILLYAIKALAFWEEKMADKKVDTELIEKLFKETEEKGE